MLSYPVNMWLPADTPHQACVLDVMRHLPRSLFSDSQMEIIEWGLEMFGIHNLPSVAVMKEINDDLQMRCGFDTIQNKGPLGHTYYVNDLSAIIAQVRI